MSRHHPDDGPLLPRGCARHAAVEPGSTCPGLLARVGVSYVPALRPSRAQVWQCSDCLICLWDTPVVQDGRPFPLTTYPRPIVARATIESVGTPAPEGPKLHD